MSFHFDTSYLEKLVLDCNRLAIEALKEKNFDTAFEFLAQAQKELKNKGRSEQVLRLKAITFNNFGCFYKRQGYLKKSLEYLLQALNYEKRLDYNTNTAGTYLNISFIFSEMNNHAEALKNTLKAIRTLEANFKDNTESITTLVIAYHNTGIEYNFLGKKNEAKNFYSQGYEIALKFLGIRHELTQTLEKAVKNTAKKEKSNPIIEKMLNYFKHHMNPRSHFSLENHKSKNKLSPLLKQPIKIPNRKKTFEHLQPIVDIHANQFKSRKKNPSVSSFKQVYKSLPNIKDSNTPAIVKKPGFAEDKFIYKNKLSIFEKNIFVDKSLPNRRKIPKNNEKNEKICKSIIIQKHVRGYLIRKKIRL